MMSRTRELVKGFAQPGSRFFARFLLTAIAYFVVAKFSLYAAIPPGNASSIWPAAAIGIVACLACGMRVAPAIWIGAVAANMTTNVSFPAAALMGIGNAAEAVVASILIQRLIAPPPYLSNGRNVLRFVAIAGASSLIAASTGAGAMTLRHYIGDPDIARNWLTWWVGDTSGIIIASPLLLTWNEQPIGALRLLRYVEVGILLGALIAATQISIGTELETWIWPYGCPKIRQIALFSSHRFKYVAQPFEVAPGSLFNGYRHQSSKVG